MLPRFEPAALTVKSEPPIGPDWLFELKYDGFRALAYVSDQVSFVSRKHHTYRRFDRLAKEMGLALSGHQAVLDGEIICVDAEGRPQFDDLLRTRSQPMYAAFDLLWLDDEDLQSVRSSNERRDCRNSCLKIITRYSMFRISNPPEQRFSKECARWIWKESWPRKGQLPTSRMLGSRS